MRRQLWGGIAGALLMASSVAALEGTAVADEPPAPTYTGSGCPNGYYPQANLPFPVSYEVKSCVDNHDDLWLQAATFNAVDLTAQQGHSNYSDLGDPSEFFNFATAAKQQVLQTIPPISNGVALNPGQYVLFTPDPQYGGSFVIGVSVDRNRTAATYGAELIANLIFTYDRGLRTVNAIAGCTSTLGNILMHNHGESWAEVIDQTLPYASGCVTAYRAFQDNPELEKTPDNVLEHVSETFHETSIDTAIEYAAAHIGELHP